MLFRKIHIPYTPEDKNGSTGWHLILRTVEEVFEYMELDAELATRAMFALPESIRKSHLEGGRECALNAMLQAKIISLKEGEKVYPHEVLSELIQGKGLAMCKQILNGEEIRVNQHGGWCTYDGFMRTWEEATVIEEVEKDGCYFPNDLKPMETDVLFIENGERVPVQFENDVYKMVGMDYKEWDVVNSNKPLKKTLDNTKKIRYKLTQLKLTDPEYTTQMIIKAKVVAFESQLVDDNQIDKMFQLFSALKDKHIIIRTTDEAKLKGHTMFENCNTRHKIEFI